MSIRRASSETDKRSRPMYLRTARVVATRDVLMCRSLARFGTAHKVNTPKFESIRFDIGALCASMAL
jgi:hypothetical protein